MKIAPPKSKTTHTPFIKQEQPPLFKKKPKNKEDNATESKKEQTAVKNKSETQPTVPKPYPTFFPPKSTTKKPIAKATTPAEKKKIPETPVIKKMAPVEKETSEKINSKESVENPMGLTSGTATPNSIPKATQAKNSGSNTVKAEGKKSVGAVPKIAPKEAPAPEKIPTGDQEAKEIVVSLPTENSNAFTKGLASQSPTNYVRGLKQSGPEMQQSLTNEKETLNDSLPVIEQPTGLPTKKAKSESGKKKEADLAASKLQQEKPVLQDLAPTGKKDGDTVEKKSEQPKATFLDRIKSFFSFSGSDEDKKSSVKSSIKKLPTSENVNTDPGEAPAVDLTGQANPVQNANNKEASDTTMQTAQQKNVAESDLYKGEDDIYPELEPEMLSPNTEISPAQANTALEKELPPVSAAVEAAFDANSKPHFDAEVSPQVEKQELEYNTMQQEQEKEQALADEKINTETQRIKDEQTAAQAGAKQEVATQRTQWKKENEGVKKDYTSKSETEKKRIDGEIDTKVAETDTRVTKEYKDAETKADNKVVETNSEAERLKTEAKEKSEKKSWWDRAVDAISDFFDALKKGLNALFDGLRSLVKGIIEAAKKLVNKLIDLARNFVVGLIKAFGEILKGLVNIALAAFPKLRDKFNAAIDKAVNGAVKVVNALAEGLKKAVNMLLDALGKVLDFILSVYQAIFNAILDVLKFLAVGLIKVLQFLWNLVLGATIAPFKFFSELAKEAIGGDPTEPLNDVEVPSGQEKPWATAMGLEENETTASTVAGTNTMDPKVLRLLSKSELSDNDVTVEPNPAVTLEDGLVSQIPQLEDGEKYGLGGAGSEAITTKQFQASAADASGYSLEAAEDTTQEAVQDTAVAQTQGVPDPNWRGLTDEQKLAYHNNQMLTASAEAGNTPPTPEKSNAKPTVDNSPEALITKTGRLDVSTRLAFMGQQMLTGLKVFWSKNKAWIIAALVAALLAAGLIAFFTGGAGLLVAVDIIAKALILIFGAIAVYKAMGKIWEYVKKAWAGDAEGAGEALARALAIIVVEFLLDKILLGMAKVFKRILKAAKATKVGKLIAKGTKVIKKGATKGGNLVKKGIAKIKNSKLVVRMSGGVGKGVKKLGKLRQKILDKFKLKRIWFVRKGFKIQLWGEFNAKVLLSEVDEQGNRTVKVKTVDSPRLKDRIGGKNRKIVGKKKAKNEIVVADDTNKFSRNLDDLEKAEDQVELQKIFDDLNNKNLKQRRRQINSGEGTQELRRGIPGKKPKDFEAHHVIPRELLNEFDDFFKKIGFNIENGKFNGIMLPPDATKLAATGSKSARRKFRKSSTHKGSHPDYTKMISKKVEKIAEDFAAGNLSKADALKRIHQLTTDAKRIIRRSKGLPINSIRF